MTSPSRTPDISTLSLSSQPNQRLHDPYDYQGSPANEGRAQYFQTSPSVPAQSQYNALGMNQSPLKNKRGGLPSQWLDSPDQNSDLSSGGGSPPPGLSGAHLAMSPGAGGPLDDDIIPTAIVIKNIPFNVKRETLLDIIASLNIPTPYAFNYHLDQAGSFRGLAFANFRLSQDADAVVAALNGFDVQGRKLRVEYKKVLQAGEKERIEREKAIRRMRSMQLEKEHQQLQQGQYDDFGAPVVNPIFGVPQRSFSNGPSSMPAAQSGYGSYSPPPMPPMPSVQAPYQQVSSPPLPSVSPAAGKPPAELDMNDPATLDIYSRILLFKDDHMRDELAFSRNLSPKQRRIVHLVAQKLGVYHYSVGEGEERHAVVTRYDPNAQQIRPAHTLSRAPSAYLNPTQSPISPALRTKKSMPDMKTLHTTAPRLSTRSSNGNIREGYATIASPSRRSPGGLGALFGNGAFGPGVIPPVPQLPASLSAPSPISESPTSGVVRQPRGPGIDGFGERRRGTGNEPQPRGGFEARSHEPLEI